LVQTLPVFAFWSKFVIGQSVCLFVQLFTKLVCCSFYQAEVFVFIANSLSNF
jgi:hypothetical protein